MPVNDTCLLFLFQANLIKYQRTNMCIISRELLILLLKEYTNEEEKNHLTFSEQRYVTIT